MNAAIKTRIANLDWERISRDLDADGYARIGRVLSSAECAKLVALYPERERFRSRIDMARLRYGLGEYKYFARPLPPLVEELRTTLYPRLAPTANRWAKLLRQPESFPTT